MEEPKAFKDMTKSELEKMQMTKESELQNCLELLKTSSAEKRRIKRDILAQKSILAEASRVISKLNENIDVWAEAVEKASYNKEKINSELREIKDHIYARLRGE